MSQFRRISIYIIQHSHQKHEMIGHPFPQLKRSTQTSIRIPRTFDRCHMKSSSNSLPVFLGTLSSSSTSPLNNESYERAAFSASRARASSESAFFCARWFELVRQADRDNNVCGGMMMIRHLRSYRGPFGSVLCFDTVYSFLLVIDLLFDLRLA